MQPTLIGFKYSIKRHYDTKQHDEFIRTYEDLHGLNFWVLELDKVPCDPKPKPESRYSAGPRRRMPSFRSDTSE